MISKELLSAVLGNESEPIHELNGVLKYLNSEFQDSVYGHQMIQREINIHELVFLCKEWAFQQRYNVYSLGKWRDSNREKYLSYSVTIKTFEEGNTYAMNKCYNDKFYADTEPEAVFKACEWIMNKKENNERF